MTRFYIDIDVRRDQAPDDECYELPSLEHAKTIVRQALVDEARRRLHIGRPLAIVGTVRNDQGLLHTARLSISSEFTWTDH